MPVTTEDILTDEDAVQAQVQETVEQRNVFANAFRTVTSLSLADPETVYFVMSNDRRGEMEIVPEGGEFPRDMEDRVKISCTRDKYGEEYAITREAEAGGIVDDMAFEAQNKMRKMSRTMDAEAHDALVNGGGKDEDGNDQPGVSGNDHGVVGDGTGDLTLADLAQAETQLMQDPYRFEPTGIYVGPQGLNDLRVGEWLNRDTAAGDRVRRTGQVGRTLGLPVYVSNAGTLGDGEAILVDNNYFGREGQWEAPDTNSYPEEETQTSTVMQMWATMGWCVTEPNAAIKVEA